MISQAEHRQRPAVVVVGLDCITGLQTARVFAKRGVPVVGLASDSTHFGCRTRVCQQIIHVDTNGQALIDQLIKLGPEHPVRPVLVPCTDNSVLQIARHREILCEWYHIAQPSAEIVELLTDKVRFPQFAAEHNLPVPRSLTLSSHPDAVAAATSIVYPAVLKPPVKTVRWQQHTAEKAILVSSADELLEAYARYSVWSDSLLLQEWIPGPLENHYTCDAYFDARSQPLVTYTSQKLRQWPYQTGVGSISRECDNADVRREAIRLFQAASFHGLAYVEMKRHAVTGQYLIIEPNIGRPTGRSTCAEATGVEMLYAMYCDTLGLPLPDDLDQQFTGRKWIYWKRDLRASWSAWRRGDLTIADWLRSLRGRKTCAVFSWSDPGPFLADWWRAVVKTVSTFAPRRSSAQTQAAPEQAAPQQAVPAQPTATAGLTGDPVVVPADVSEPVL